MSKFKCVVCESTKIKNMWEGSMFCSKDCLAVFCSVEFFPIKGLRYVAHADK